MPKSHSREISTLTNVRRFLFAIAIPTLLAGCGSGSSGESDSGESNPGRNVVPSPPKLSSLSFKYSETPTQDHEITVSLMTDSEVGEVDWEVSLQPGLTNLLLSESTDNKSVTFTASEPGDYAIVARSVSDSSEKITTFSISPVFSFDESKIEGNDGSVNIDEIIGVIKNQAWVYSASLNETQLRDIVINYDGLTIVGYDSVEGLLVEFDDSDISTKEEIELLKLEEGVSSVENRVYEGESVPREEAITPDDGSSFNDGGDNWHLEKINATAAWEFTTGSSDILIGVSDSGFDETHNELGGKVSEVLTSKASDHGNGVAGAIGANTDNKQGVSGINWSSKLVLGLSGNSNLKSILGKKNVVTVNSSWAIPGYLPSSFDPTDSDSVTARDKDTLSVSRSYRKLANANLDKLLVWSAGNGIANGGGNSNGVYGVDGRHHSPALHYNSNGSLQKQENVIFVAALRDDNRLAYYSNYGQSVDLAAPTSYRSLKTNGGFYTGSEYGNGLSGFVGTSAAAPVATGVASLVYSLYPGFSGKEVKDILVNSATSSVSERYIEPGDAGENNSNIEALAHSIPILNAEKALEKAQEIIDSKVTVSDSIPDPFTAQARVLFNSIDDDLDVVGIEWELQSSNDGGATWNYVDGMSVNGDTAEPFLDTATPYQRIVATITLRNPDNNNETTANKEYEFSYATVGISTVDTVSLESLPSVEIGMELLAGVTISPTGFTDSNGIVQTYLKAGTYKARGRLNGYQEAVTSFTVSGLQSQQVTLNMTTDSIGSVGSLSGEVIDVNGNPVVGASVRISGGAQTNGFFASATTGANGNYVISNISKTDSTGNSIPSFILEASAFGYASIVKKEVIVLAGKDRAENFTLTSVDLSESTVFSDDFETGVGDWTATGFWNHIDLSSNVLVNTLVDEGYTSLAPDEAGPHASLPGAFNGDFVWWYGQPDTGSFIGTQSSSDSPLSGGRSTSSNSGRLTSPSINLGLAATPYLRFRTWWEIESVNPNENGFDIMEIQISVDGGTSYTTIKRLNPFVDPNDSNRKSKPFSSGGYNRKPVWALEEIDLTDYAGEVITLRFDFRTNDGLFNGFRGWIVDTLEIVDFSSAGSSANADNKSQLVLVDDSSQFKFMGKKVIVEDGFFDVHKKPQVYSTKTVAARE